MPKFDVILGIDWLARHHATFKCRDQKVSFKGPRGNRVTYQKKTSKKGAKIVSVMQLQKLERKGHQVYLCSINEVKDELRIEDIPVVQEYPDVFPDELPGLPPARDVEFSDLVPGTPPISKVPHRMAPVELKELKEQLEEMIEKGFVRPSVSP
ncbi:hypothetical protein vseg_010898 [Gypsophila vaccaria]